MRKICLFERLCAKNISVLLGVLHYLLTIYKTSWLDGRNSKSTYCICFSDIAFAYHRKPMRPHFFRMMFVALLRLHIEREVFKTEQHQPLASLDTASVKLLDPPFVWFIESLRGRACHHPSWPGDSFAVLWAKCGCGYDISQTIQLDLDQFILTDEDLRPPLRYSHVERFCGDRVHG